MIAPSRRVASAIYLASLIGTLLAVFLIPDPTGKIIGAIACIIIQASGVGASAGCCHGSDLTRAHTARAPLLRIMDAPFASNPPRLPLQFMALVWYTASYIPFAQAFLKTTCAACTRRALPAAGA